MVKNGWVPKQLSLKRDSTFRSKNWESHEIKMKSRAEKIPFEAGDLKRMEQRLVA